MMKGIQANEPPQREHQGLAQQNNPTYLSSLAENQSTVLVWLFQPSASEKLQDGTQKPDYSPHMLIFFIDLRIKLDHDLSTKWLPIKLLVTNDRGNSNFYHSDLLSSGGQVQSQLLLCRKWEGLPNSHTHLSKWWEGRVLLQASNKEWGAAKAGRWQRGQQGLWKTQSQILSMRMKTRY